MKAVQEFVEANFSRVKKFLFLKKSFLGWFQCFGFFGTAFILKFKKVCLRTGFSVGVTSTKKRAPFAHTFFLTKSVQIGRLD